MALALLLAAALAWWLHHQGLLLPNLWRLGIASLGALIAVRLLSTGKPLAGAVVLAGTWAWWQFQARRRPDPLADARARLGVGRHADAAAINAAWRTAMTHAHPDAGGTATDARELTAARDALLAALLADSSQGSRQP